MLGCMKTLETPTEALPSNSTSNNKTEEKAPPRRIRRRAFLRGVGLGAIALGPGTALIGPASKAFGDGGEITDGAAAMVSFLAAAGNLQTRFWLHFYHIRANPTNCVPA